jgi:type I restriction enzyme M protein
MTASEQDQRALIDPQLKNLRWKLTGSERQVFREIPKTAAQKKQLDGKRPDYILYRANSDKPLIVIEAKKAGANMSKALEQAARYAEMLGAPLAFASDGLMVKSRQVKFGRPLLWNGEEVEEFLRESRALLFAGQYEVNTHAGSARSREDLISIFRGADQILRGEGLTQGLPRFVEFANILFIKIFSELEAEREERGEKKISLDPAWRWLSLREKHGEELRAGFGRAMAALQTRYQGVFGEMKIKKPETLEKIVGQLDDVSLIDLDADIKGEAFEFFIRRYNAQKNDLAQYFTPRHIVRAMTLLANPAFGEKVYDPFCGTGGILTEAYKHIGRAMPRNAENLRILREKTVWGADISEVARIAKMNMIIIGDGHANIAEDDSLAHPRNGKYDIVMSNIPFSQPTEHGALYGENTRDGDVVCLRHCLDAVNKTAENGRLCVIVPEGLLYGGDDAAKRLREHLVGKCRVRLVVSLPREVFRGYTTAKTDILLIDKINRGHEKNARYFAVKNDGLSLDTRRQKIPGVNDLDRLIENRNDDGAFDVFIPAPPLFSLQYHDQTPALKPRGAAARLGDLVCVMRRTVAIGDSDICREPTISSKTQKISLRQARHGRNVKGKNRFLILPGDLVFSRMHTQDGLFAVSSERFHATGTFLICRVKEDRVYTPYLLLALKYVIPTLRIVDTTGRENYSREAILNLPIPLPPRKEQKAMTRKWEQAKARQEQAAAAIGEEERKLKAAMFTGD